MEAPNPMVRPKVEWDPSWDDDWQALQDKLEHEIEEEHPHNPDEAVELYRYGFSAAQKHPMHDWTDVESELYQDYMGGAPEPGEQQEEEMDWERVSEWARRGWEAARI